MYHRYSTNLMSTASTRALLMQRFLLLYCRKPYQWRAPKHEKGVSVGWGGGPGGGGGEVELFLIFYPSLRCNRCSCKTLLGENKVVSRHQTTHTVHAPAYIILSGVLVLRLLAWSVAAATCWFRVLYNLSYET